MCEQAQELRAQIDGLKKIITWAILAISCDDVAEAERALTEVCPPEPFQEFAVCASQASGQGEHT